MVEFSSLVVSAPAKVILHGEHSVVYGKVSVAASVDLRTTLTWEKPTNDAVELCLCDLGFSSSWTTNQIKEVQISPSVDVDAFKIFLGSHEVSEVAYTAVWAFVYLYRSIYGERHQNLPGGFDISHNLPSGKFVLKSDIPVGAGLGSSASYCTALATAMLITSGVFEPAAIARSEAFSSECNIQRDECLRMISQWAYKAETIIHGKPSGIDNTVSTFGGFLQFQAGQIENIKRVPELNIFLINTNIPRSTKTMVAGLRQRYEEMPKVYDHLFCAISEISVECRRILERLCGKDLVEKTAVPHDSEKDRTDCFSRLEKLIDLNQDILRTLGVSHSVINKVCEATMAYDLHSKLTGAGGGGFVITLLKQDMKPETLDRLSKELKEIGCDCLKTKLGGGGVAIHDWAVNENIKQS